MNILWNLTLKLFYVGFEVTKSKPLKDPVLPTEHCMLQSLGGHFCDVENSTQGVCALSE